MSTDGTKLKHQSRLGEVMRLPLLGLIDLTHQWALAR